MSAGVKAAALAAGIAALLGLTGCDHSSRPASASSTVPFSETACGTNSGRGCAPASERVDLKTPTFTQSTEITNPLFPISRLRSVVLLGYVDGKPFRTETTLLPGTRTVVWRGQKIRVRISQYLAYLDRQITEVALDRYAQADDGSVWYLGEDVFDYEQGTIKFTEGTWLAGREGPPAMIMPAHPKVGDVYRTENAPGIVFEEVSVKSVGSTVKGPRGPVHGAMVARELHSDGTSEDKLFAPGYGEFRTSGGGDLEALALAVPIDAAIGPRPRALDVLSIGANAILEAARLEDWETAVATLRRMKAAWQTVQAEANPPLIRERLNSNLPALVRAVSKRKPAQAAQKAIDVEQSALDLELRYRPAFEIDRRRFELWTQQLRVYAAVHNLGGVTGAVAVLEWIRERFAQTLPAAKRRQLDQELRALRVATDAKNLPAAADQAARLVSLLRL